MLDFMATKPHLDLVVLFWFTALWNKMLKEGKTQSSDKIAIKLCTNILKFFEEIT